MIRITGYTEKYLIYERLCESYSTLGIVLYEDDQYSGAGYGFIFRDPTPEKVRKFLEEGDFPFVQEVVIYSNYTKEQIAPYVGMLRNMEQFSDFKFVVMSKE